MGPSPRPAPSGGGARSDHLSTLDDDSISLIAFCGEPIAAVHLATTCKSINGRLVDALAHIRSTLPPPYSADALDQALQSGDAEAARPLLVE